MENKTVESVPYLVHEADMARQERTIKRLWILLILVIVLLVGSNCAWIYYESSFEDEYDLSLTAVKNIIWKQGDKVLLKASKPG